MGEVQFGKQSGYSTLGIDDVKALLNHPLQINPPPAHNAVCCLIRAGFDNLAKLFHLFIAQHARLACAFAVGQTIHTLLVEPVNPIAQRLAVHTADLRSLSAAYPVINRRESQKPAGLAAIRATFGNPSKASLHQNPGVAEQQLAWQISFASPKSEFN